MGRSFRRGRITEIIFERMIFNEYRFKPKEYNSERGC